MVAQGLPLERYLHEIPAGLRAAEGSTLFPDMLSEENLSTDSGRWPAIATTTGPEGLRSSRWSGLLPTPASPRSSSGRAA